MSPFHHRHSGLVLAAAWRLPAALTAEVNAPDVTVERVAPDRLPIEGVDWVMVNPPGTLWHARTEEGTRIRLRFAVAENWAEYIIDERGVNVYVAHAAGVTPEEAGELLLGPVMQCVLSQRGVTCLHAAVVSVRSRVLALLGSPGAGKSTTALALVQHGATLVADDVAVLTDLDGRIGVRPGASRIRLRPDAGRAMVPAFETLATVWGPQRPGSGKRSLPVSRRDDEHPQALDRAYFLVPGGDGPAGPSLRRLTAAEALPMLMAHRPMAWGLTRACAPRDFERLAAVAQTVPAAELRRADGLDAIAPTVAAIVSDVCSRA